MSEPPALPIDDRVIVLAPTERDAAVCRSILAGAGMVAVPCADVESLCRELAAGAGVAVLTEEAVAGDIAGRLATAIQSQPPWSDMPLVVLTAGGADSPAAALALETLGNVTLLDRPVRVSTLISAVRAALRSRHKQYEVRDHLAERVRSAEALREADRRKDEFLATLAHELRNPLAPIRNGLQVLRLAGGGSEMVAEARIMMERQLGHMVRLVDDLLDMSRITRNKLELRRERVALATVIHDAVETGRPLIEQFGHTFSMTLPPNPVYLDADPVRLAQVFSNLLTNAAKYTESGGRISLKAELHGGEVLVRVADTGLGIPAEALPSIFEMFSQVDRNLERAQGGLGIGLTLVKRLAEMHGGTVEARSQGPGQGSEFIVRLPVVKEGHHRPDRGTTDEGVQGGSKRRILVVDDNRDSATSLGMVLTLMGNVVRTAGDGLAAVEAAQEFRPEMILLDLGLPKLNGYDACRRIRAQPWSEGVVIVALTGWGQEEDRRRSQEAGFDHHLVKPVDPASLAKLLVDSWEQAGPVPTS